MGATPAIPSSNRDYQLSDDLAKLCLPQEFKDSNRNLAWANSICLLFVVVGLIGVRPPAVFVRAITEPTEVMQVFVPPDQEEPPPQEFKPEEIEVADVPPDAPQVAVVAVMANTPDIAFAVPTPGVTNVVGEARFASSPPTVANQPQQAPLSGPVKFNPHAAGEGYFPDPEYPAIAIRNQQQGTVEVRIKVDASGVVTSAEVQKSSRFSVLDETALRTVRSRWRFPAGGARDYIWPCTFRLK